MRRRSLFVSLFTCLISVLLFSAKTSAQIRADPTAPGTQRPTILQAGNGVPLVNIQTPSAAGISRNTYSQFDVNRNGAILNNSRSDTQTQLGGWVQGNPWLGGGSARIILNEVNSTNPSYLNGWIEVAGKPAQVITANPAGITCDGCGFINTPQATLATGTPVMNRGSLDGYRVQGGQVRIEGLGLDGRQADAVTILTRSAEINAPLWAKRLNVVTGTNEVTVDANGQPVDIKPIIISPFPQNFSINTSGPQTKGNTAPVFALDVAYLGGMYAGHIFLVGSEHGLGVRNSGTLFAGQQLTLDSNGILSVKDKGKITAPELAIKTEGAIDNSGVIAAQRSATIDTSGTLTNTGTIASQQRLSITAQALTNTINSNTVASELAIKTEGAIDNSGVIAAQRSVTIDTSGRLSNAGTIVSQQGLSITAQALTNTSNSNTVASELAIKTEGAIDNSGVIAAQRSATIDTSGRLSNAGTIASQQGLSITAQALTIGSNTLPSAKGNITAAELSIKTEGAIDNAGEIIAQRSATIETNSTLTNTGTIASQEALSITAQQLTNTGNSTTNASGLIDGQTVFINSARIENRGDGRIYGDHLILQADTLVNAGETINDITHSPVIAARRHLAMGVGTLENRDGGLVLSGGDLSVGRTLQSTTDPTTGDTHYTTTGLANRINNDSATIEVLGDVFIQAIALANRNTHLQITQFPEAPFVVERVQPAGSNAMYLASQCGHPPSIFGASFFLLCSADGRQETFEDYTWYTLTGSPVRSQVVGSQPAVFRVGGHFSVKGDGSASSRLTNQDSQIIVGGDIDLTDTALNNQETKGTYRVQYSGTAEYTTVEWCGSLLSESHCRKWHGQFAYQSAPEVTTIDLPTGHRYAGNLNQSSGSGGNASTQLPTSLTTSLTTQLPTSPPAIPPIPIPALPGSANGANSANSALFTLSANPQSLGGYLIETDPRFARYRQWISSDYLLNQLAVDPARTQKRAGDGYYEQSLIRDQVGQLTGRRFLPGYTDDEAQYLALMTNAVTVAKELHLRPGIALSADQVAALTSDIVWLVEQDVTLPDGSKTAVLVPTVYARIKEGDLQADGSLISGRSITARLKGDLTNSGLIAADQNVVVTAENIHNLKGSIDGRDVRLYADVDINHLGGRIAAVDRLKLQAGRDVNVQSTTQTTETQLSATEAAQGNRFTRTQVDRVAGIYVRGADSTQSTTTANANTNTTSAADNTLNLTAGRNLTLSAAQIQNTTAGTTTLTAGEHLQIATVTTGHDDKAVKDANNHSHIAHREDVGTQITTNGALQLSAAQDLTLRAATVTSGGAIDAQAGNNLRIEAGQAESLNDQARKTTHRGTLSRTTTTTRDRFEDNTSVATTLSGNSVNASAANDITVQGSNVVADKDIELNAGRDLNIVASTDTHAEDHYQHKAKSGVFSSGGAGITLGRRTQSTDQQSTRTTSSASTIGSLDGNIDLQAGRTYTQTGSDVIALGQSSNNNSNNSNSNSNNGNNSPTNTPIQTSGDITITAQQVSITEARETSRTDIQTQFKQSGVTVAVSAPVITAAQTVEQMGQAAGNTSDPRMKALAAANAAMAINQAADAIKKNPDQLGGVNLTISVGSSKAQSQSTSTTDTSAPSHATATHNLSVKATKEDITVQGSQLKAGNTVTLQAEQQLKLEAARNTAEQHSTNSNQSASIGVGFTVGAKQTGVNLNLAASKGRGNADGSDVTWINTEVAAGQQIKTESGTNTTIRGGVLTAPQVTITTGTSGNGNLTIESLQDTSQYKSQQKQQGATLSIPIAGGTPSGSVSTKPGKVESDYASVKQQSGIRAGDEGFQVNVQGDTTLRGGAITSTQAAVDNNKNTFHTDGALTTSDINNKAVYEAKSVGVNLGVGFSPSGQLAPQGTGVGLGTDSDRQNSTTQAGISDIAGNKAARTGDAETGLTNRFDADRVQKDINAQTQITQIFGTYAAKAVGDYAQLQLNQARNLRAEAEQLSTGPPDQEDKPRAQQLLTEAKQIEAQWGEGGSYRIALHTATAGLSGGLSGALGGAATATTAPLLNDLQTSLSKTLKQAGASDEAADGIAQSISTVTAAGIGASVGIASGNGLAGAATAVNVDANNRQLHPDDYKVARDNAKLVAKKLGITEDEAEGRIVRQLQRDVDGATAQQDAGKRDEPIISILGCGLLKCDAKSTDPNYWNPAYNAEYIKPNQSSYDKGVAQSNAGLTPEQIEERNNRAGAPIAKAGVVILGGYILAPTVAVIGTELIAFTRNPVLYCTANPTACISAVDVAAGTAAGVPLTGVPVPHAVPNTTPISVTSTNTIAASEIRFSQNSISFGKIESTTKQAYTYDDLVASMRTNGWKGDPIDVVRMPDGRLTSIDNTRIMAAREAGIDAQVNVRPFDAPLTADEIGRFTKGGQVPSTWGDAVMIRINSQSGRFGVKYPYGADQLPRLTGGSK